MGKQPNLFDPPADDGRDDDAPIPAPAGPPAPLSVSQFNERVASFLKGLFPGTLRIQGHVSGFARSWGRGSHVYFDLHEKDPGDGERDLARVPMVIWRGTRRRVEGDVAILGGPRGELDDLAVTFEVSVNYWVQGGRLSLVVEGIDLEASLGAQKLDRERVLRLLAAEGLLDRNRELSLPAVPLRLGLATSLESAAYHDFVKELSQSGIAFTLRCVDARVQGPEMEADMQAAFARLGALAGELDAVILIRGGGSRGDLAGFDGERLARAVATCPLPVLAGIGHEIDRSIADEVAHRSLKTPTAVAQFLVGRVEDWLGALEEKAGRVRLAGERSLRAASALLDGRSHRLQALAGGRLTRAAGRVNAVAGRLPGAARQRLRLAGLGLRSQSRRLLGAAHQPLRLAGLELGHRAARLPLVPREVLLRHARELDHRAERLRLLDPMNVLKRGFSVTRDGVGRILRGVAGLAPGARIATRLADGVVDSEIASVRPDGPEAGDTERNEEEGT